MSEGADCSGKSSVDRTTYGGFASRAIGLAGFVGLWAWMIAGRSDIEAFMDLESIVLVLGCPFALLLAAFGWSGTGGAMFTLFVGRGSPGANLNAASFFRLAAALTLGCGFLATLVWLVLMLQNMNDPQAIGPAMAVALLPELYGVVVALLCLAAAAAIASRERCDEGTAELAQLGRQSVRVAGVAAGAGVCMILLVFFVSWLSISEIKRDARFDSVTTRLRTDFGQMSAGSRASPTSSSVAPEDTE